MSAGLGSVSLAMESTIVIKVKYGETLRRFNALVADDKLAIGMDGLREKVFGLFNFASDADLTLTYVDEDGDFVTLVDEEDLCDAMRQSLNPLRITVSLNSEKSGRSCTRSSGSSTPMRSPQVQQTFQNMNSSISEMLKSLPEPIREALSKLSLDLASKATSSAPGIAELVDCLTKIRPPYLNQISQFQTGAQFSTHSGDSGSGMGAPVAKDSEDSKVDGAKSEVVPSTKSEVPTSHNNEVLPNSAFVETTLENSEVNLGNVLRGMKVPVWPSPLADASAAQLSGFVNPSAGLSGDDFSSKCAPMERASGKSYGPIGRNKKPEKSDDGVRFVNATAVATNISFSDNNRETKKLSECDTGPKSAGIGASSGPLDYLKWCNPDFQATNLGGGTRMKPESDSGNTSGSHTVFSPFNERSLIGMPHELVAPPEYAPVVPLNRSDNRSGGMGGIVHRGVCCDGCGVHPITGPRFKSKMKEDYDLCSICFAEMGNEAEYIRMDWPVTSRHPLSFKGLYDAHSRMHPKLPPVLRGWGMKRSRSKLDSRFIQDVNVLDGTIVAPSTSFTKIWRMRNSGTIAWPQGTQLVWIMGDRLSTRLSVDVEIPADGLPVDKELDIAVDFIAPELPGRYISYWMMASSSGQKFGQHVWVFIQVGASLKDSACESMHGLNLNLPPTSSGMTATDVIDANVEPTVEDSLPKPDHHNKAAELVGPVLEMRQNKEHELHFPINDTLLVGGSMPNNVSSVPPSSVPYPIIDFSEAPAVAPPPQLLSPPPQLLSPPTPPTIPFSAPSPCMNMQASSQQPGENYDVEQTLLKELEDMGFKQVDLNKEILRMNEYNLEQSVDDLCGPAKWDPLLEELQEMGFWDKEMNKRLLKKNNGSIKRVVMDLIAGEKA